MSKSIIATTVAFASAALAQTAGQAVVVNSCSYPVYLQNTPAAGGGFSNIVQTLNSGETYSQTWTQLTNLDGWSIKLSRVDGSFQSEVMQYEYTWHGWDGEYGGLIWYDLSDVNGNPWDGNWALSATGSCDPRQAAYQFPTDDEYGEQSCPGESSVTVTLCSEDGSSGSNNGGSSPSPAETSTTSSSPAAVTSTAAVTTTAAPTTQSAPEPTSWTWHFGSGDEKVANGNGKKNKGTPTTLATIVTANRGGVTVTEVATEVVTSFVTATAEAGPAAVEVAARHEHLARHQHHHRH